MLPLSPLKRSRLVYPTPSPADVDQLPAPSYKVPSLESLPGPTHDGLTATMLAAKEWLHGRVAYRLQQLATAHVSTKVLALWLVALPFIMLAAAVYQRAAAVSFKEAMYKVRVVWCVWHGLTTWRLETQVVSGCDVWCGYV